MKDWLKIDYYQDKKTYEEEKKKIKLDIADRIYPEHFNLPLMLQFELTSNCNLYCKHCYNNSGGICNKDLMTPSKWKDFAKYLVEKGGIFQCVISGGEPLLLGDDLFDIMDILDNDGTTFLLISNGYLLNKEYAKRFSKYRFKWFQISIDGATAEYHDNFRGKIGSWEKATNAVVNLVNEGIPVAIAHTVTPQNMDNIDDMCGLAYSLGASSILIGEITPCGRASQDMQLVPNHEQKNYIREKVIENSVKYKNKMLIQRSSTVKLQLSRYVDVPNTGAVIRPNGQIRLDCMAPFVMGNILKDDFLSLWNKKADYCWQHELVKEYINSYEDFLDINHMKTNYYDNDILI